MAKLHWLADNVRPYHIALAHAIANTKAGDDAMEQHIRRFLALPSFEQTLCRIELAECRAAMRGQRLAVVA